MYGSLAGLALEGLAMGLVAPAPPAMGAEAAFLPLWLPMRLPGLVEAAPRYVNSQNLVTDSMRQFVHASKMFARMHPLL